MRYALVTCLLKALLPPFARERERALLPLREATWNDHRSQAFSPIIMRHGGC